MKLLFLTLHNWAETDEPGDAELSNIVLPWTPDETLRRIEDIVRTLPRWRAEKADATTGEIPQESGESRPARADGRLAGPSRLRERTSGAALRDKRHVRSLLSKRDRGGLRMPVETSLHERHQCIL